MEPGNAGAAFGHDRQARTGEDSSTMMGENILLDGGKATI